MLDEAAEFRLELDGDWLIDRDDRTTCKRVALVLGIVAALVLIVSSSSVARCTASLREPLRWHCSFADV